MREDPATATGDIDAAVAAFAATLDTLPTATPDPPLAGGIPVHSGLQAEGDVIVLPTTAALPAWAQPLPPGGTVPLITEGNGHVLRALTRRAGTVHYADPDPAGDPFTLAIVQVAGGPAGRDAVLLVEQPGGGHTPIAVGPGRYELRRQRERRATPATQSTFNVRDWAAAD